MGLLDVNIAKQRRKIFKETSISYPDKETSLNIKEPLSNETLKFDNTYYQEDKNIASEFISMGIFGGKMIDEVVLEIIGEYGTKDKYEIIEGLQKTYKIGGDSSVMVFNQMLEKGVITKLIGGRYHLTGGVPF
ncbi:MAG: hypothetical protein RBS14_01605 [Atribacterota bacterium]|jgi:hypothetical protein|nr:hypothetical protein [Atribacterota bacterium]